MQHSDTSHVMTHEHLPGDDDDADGVGGALDAMSPLCPLDDEHLPLVVDSLKGKQVCTI